MKRLLSLLLVFLLACPAALLAACDNGTASGAAAYAHLDRSGLFGIDEPILESRTYTYDPNTGEYDHTVENFNLEATAYLAGAIGAKSMRFRIPARLMTDSENYDQTMLNYMKRAATLLNENGVTHLIGMLEVFPKSTGFIPDSSNSVPDQNDPYYDDWMNAVYLQTKTICSLFPEITMWEMGNEPNSAVFFHPNGYEGNEGTLTPGSGGFEWDELVAIYTDYMYYMAKGIHEANPDNIAFAGGYAFPNGALGNYEGIQWFIEDTYTQIKEGRAPSNVPEDERSTDVRDYFDGLSWHPYANRDVGVTEEWLSGNNQIYSAAIANGDEGIPVIFTEFGFHDDGDEAKEIKQIGYMEQAFEYMQNDMPYVVACCAFRMYQCQYAVSWGGTAQNYWGYFTEDLDGSGVYPRQKAIELQKLYGGTGDLYKYARGIVLFDSNGGTNVASQTVSLNGKVVEPAQPVRPADSFREYVFDGWYYGDKKWDFDNDTVTEKTMTLVAKWHVSGEYTEEFLPEDIEKR